MRKQITPWVTLILLFSLLPLVGPAQAAPAGLSQGDDFLISRVVGDVRAAPAIAYNDDLDQYLVVWSDNRAGTSDIDIYGQIVTGDGVPVGDNLLIRDETDHLLIYPDVAYDTQTGRYLVVWEDANEFDIEGQFLNADGSPYASALNIAEGDVSDWRSLPAVACYAHAANGVCIVAYQRWGSGVDIYSRLVDPGGTVLGSEYPISTATDNQTDPDIAVDPATGHFLIAWEDGRATLDRIYGCIQYASGFLGTEFAISTATTARYNPALAFSPDAGTAGEWLVVFERDVNGNSQIAGRRVDAAGSAVGDQINICSKAEDQIVPAVAYDAYDGQYLVAWEDLANGASNHDIYGRHVALDGSLDGEILPFSTVPDNQEVPAVAASTARSGGLVVLSDERTDDVSGQVIGGGGAPVGHGFALSIPINDQRFPALAYNSQDTEYLVVWQDARGSTVDIWGQRIDLDGTLLGDSFAIDASDGDQVQPDVAYNPVTNQYLVVWEDRYWAADPDIYGRRVNGNGSLDGNSFAIGVGGAIPCRTPSVTYNPISGEYLVVYTYEAENDNVRGRRVPASAPPAGADIDIATGAAEQNYPDVACRSIASGGGYLVVWRENDGGQRDVKGRRVGQGGSLQGSELDICTQADSQWSPKVAYSPETDRYLVIWPDDRDAASQGRNLYGRQVSALSDLYAETALSTAANAQSHPALTYGQGLRNYVATWDDERGSDSPPDLYAQRIDNGGTPVETPASSNDLLLEYAGWQQFPAVAWAGDLEQGLVVWEDGRNGESFHIYGLPIGGSGGYTVFLPVVLRNH